jgi:hypothetical protein
MPVNIPLPLGPSGIGVSSVVGLSEEDKTDTSAYIEEANTYTVEHKLCKCCDIYFVIFLLSTAELVDNK